LSPPQFGQGTFATQSPITCPNRRKQPERYVTLPLKNIEKIIGLLVLINVSYSITIQ